MDPFHRAVELALGLGNRTGQFFDGGVERAVGRYQGDQGRFVLGGHLLQEISVGKFFLEDVVEPLVVLFLLVQVLPGRIDDRLVLALFEFMDRAVSGSFEISDFPHGARQTRRTRALGRIERFDLTGALPLFGQREGGLELDRQVSGAFKRGRDRQQFLRKLIGYVVRLAGQFQATRVVGHQCV